MIELVNQQWVVSGQIDFGNAETYYQQGLALLKNTSQFPVIVDLSQLQQGSTLALATFVQLLRQTPEAKGLHFKSVPKKMVNIIQSCHLEHDLILID